MNKIKKFNYFLNFCERVVGVVLFAQGGETVSQIFVLVFLIDVLSVLSCVNFSANLSLHDLFLNAQYSPTGLWCCHCVFKEPDIMVF